LTPIHYNCDFILVPATLKMATWVAETCRCLLTITHSSASVGIIKNCMELQASSLHSTGQMVSTHHPPTTAIEQVHAYKTGT